MTNVKEEFLEHIKGKSKVKCAELYTEHWGEEGEDRTYFRLKLGYNEEDLKEFLSKIDFSYNSGFGGQELYGLVWFEDGTWLDRGEYDGSEWWQHQSCPEISLELKEAETNDS